MFESTFFMKTTISSIRGCIKGFAVLLLFFASIVNPLTAVASLGEDEDEITSNALISELQSLRAQLTNMEETQTNLIYEEALLLNDRFAALDQRLLTIEGRINSIYGEFDGLQFSFTIALAIMVAIALLTVMTVLVLRRKVIDPLHVQLARLRTEVSQSTGGDSQHIKLALKDLATDDPYLSQILKRHQLL